MAIDGERAAFTSRDLAALARLVDADIERGCTAGSLSQLRSLAIKLSTQQLAGQREAAGRPAGKVPAADEIYEVYTGLQQMISTGRLEPGVKIPAVASIARTYGVEYDRARKAIQALWQDGLLDGPRMRELQVADVAAGDRRPERRHPPRPLTPSGASVFEGIQQMIETGRWPAGMAVPDARSLARLYRVRNDEAGAAVQQLWDEGLIEGKSIRALNVTHQEG